MLTSSSFIPCPIWAAAATLPRVNRLTDQQLLRDYAERRSEAAFAELVRRHIDLIYSAALRMVCDSHLAEDVTQGAFVALARSAPQLTGRAVLYGWLHRTAQNIAAQTVRTDVRRRAREQEAAAMNELLANESDAAWQRIAPHLDAALGELSEADRDAVMLRYFERKSAQEMAQVLGVSDEAAQKRVTRAVERLREFFAKRGVNVGASGFVVVLSANAVQAAPVGLAVTISTAATIAGSTLATTVATKTALTTMNWINAKSIAAIVASVLVAGGSTYLIQEERAIRLRTEHQELSALQAKLAEERDAALSAAQAESNEVSALRKEQTELLRLRSEVGILRKHTNELGNLRQANSQLQAALAEAGKATRKPETESELEQRILRPRLAKIMTLPLLMYANENQGVFPADFELASAYFREAVQADPFLGDESKFLEATRLFEIVYHGPKDTVTDSGSMILIREKQARQRPDGRWERAYGFADGHGEVRVELDGRVDAWERLRATVPTVTRTGAVVDNAPAAQDKK
jgi:RNA polymerase sigma factor (sigma-70 family)